ncbi:MAG: GAF and ANTAR domain-containing protein [Pseudonocardiaceae bacterium]
MSVWLLCETAVFRLGVSGAAVTVNNAAGWPETRHSTDALSARLVELQVTVGEGPCADAYQAGGPILVADLDSSAIQRRWPLFAPLAVEAGARALFTFPLCVGTIRLGILALHRIEPRPLGPATLADSLVFADFALRLLLDEQAGLPTRDGGLPLHNPQVHQATGMISAQLNVEMEDAFARLRARAFTDQRPLAELAADIVARRLRFDPTGEAR